MPATIVLIKKNRIYTACHFSENDIVEAFQSKVWDQIFYCRKMGVRSSAKI